MDLKKKYDSFNKRFGIVEAHDPIKEFNKFKARVLNVFEKIDYHASLQDIKNYCNAIGERVKKCRGPGSEQDNIIFAENIYNSLESEIDELKFYQKIQIILICK